MTNERRAFCVLEKSEELKFLSKALSSHFLTLLIILIEQAINSEKK